MLLLKSAIAAAETSYLDVRYFMFDNYSIQ